ncbi:MAG: ATP-dependent helicase HrpB [Acidobacteria bacterium]|nr:ATP-dependent helicase HrpB [Acidobacteriota bacterium]
MNPLPIDPHLPKIISTLRDSMSLVLTAPPGAGKTTRIPRALYDAGFTDHGEIWILEPRRLATRLAAARVAQELGERLGETVGYAIRFENVSGPGTRIRFLTEAILARSLVHNPNLDGVSTVILDEFHERHLATDLALAFLRQLLSRRPQLKIIVMSATMNAESVASFLPGASVLSLAESPFDLDIDYETKTSDRPLHEKVAGAVVRLMRSDPGGNILVFLPGAAEIRRAAETLKPSAEHMGFSLNLLHGDLPNVEQRRAIEPSGKMKVILATNVAETSITIPDIAAVVDSGLARIAGYSPWSGFPTLATSKISKSSAKQRAGRAGRTRAGRVLRLYTRPDFETRPEHETPEIKRADLTETVLLLHGAGIQDIGSFVWFQPPPASAIEAAESLLFRLGAVNSCGKISESGIRMLKLPIHPRLARLILEGEKQHVVEESTLLAALLAERDIRLNVRTRLADPQSRHHRHASGPSDLLELLDCFKEAERAGFEADRLLDLGLDARTVQAVRRGQRQLQHILSTAALGRKRPSSQKPVEEAILISVLTAFPDRVAKRRRAGSGELLLAGGGSAMLSAESVVHDPQLVVAVDVEERKERASARMANPIIRLASGIEAEWIAGLFPESLSQETELVWNERAGRVHEVRRTSYGQIALEEMVRTATPSEKASNMLASAVFRLGLSPFHDAGSLPGFQARLALLSKCFPGENLPAFADPDIRLAVEQLCRSRRSLDEVVDLSLVDGLLSRLTDRQRALLRREAPDRIKLKSGRTVRVHYEPEKPPWIESRLQDFFGTYATPAICSGQIPLTIHLLAPNGRAVQVTKDLAGFWKKHYPSIRRELQRRYPKHAWPDPETLTDRK